jgi:hypothetical protein
VCGAARGWGCPRSGCHRGGWRAPHSTHSRAPAPTPCTAPDTPDTHPGVTIPAVCQRWVMAQPAPTAAAWCDHHQHHLLHITSQMHHVPCWQQQQRIPCACPAVHAVARMLHHAPGCCRH